MIKLTGVSSPSGVTFHFLGFHAKCFLDTLLQDSLSKMLIHQIKLTCAELHNVAVASWKDRHKCILLVNLRLDLNRLI